MMIIFNSVSVGWEQYEAPLAPDEAPDVPGRLLDIAVSVTQESRSSQASVVQEDVQTELPWRNKWTNAQCRD